MNQVPLSITDSHRRALAFHASTSAAADFARAIDHAGSVMEALQIHQELETLRTAYERLAGKALDKADAILLEK